MKTIKGKFMLGYEEEYHKLSHHEYLTNEHFYNMQSKLALNKYFNNIPKNLKILDFGCGMGQNTYLLPNVIGYDISKFALDICRKKGMRVIDDLKMIKDNSMDIVFCANVLEHTENPFMELERIYQKLKKGGKVIIILPAEEIQWSKKRHGLEGDITQHLFIWNFRCINNLLIKIGFKVIENKFFRRGGERRLLFLSHINFKFYEFMTKIAGLLKSYTQFKVVGIKC